MPRAKAWVATAITAALALTGCGGVSTGSLSTPEKPSVVTTTGILADLTRNVVGDRMDVEQIVPEGADPHSYEPTLRDVRQIAYADAAFSNYMLLEDQSVIRTLDATIREDVPNVALAESAIKYSAEVIPLVENVSLDTIWLGMRAQGDGLQNPELSGVTRSSTVELTATDFSGPGDLVAYLTESFGNPRFYIDTSDGIDHQDHAQLPLDAHTHMSWAFNEPGVYQLTVNATVNIDDSSEAQPLAEDKTVTFAVGVNPHEVDDSAQVLDEGHADISANVDTGEIEVLYDPSGGGEHVQQAYDPEDVVISVPTQALEEIPPDPSFRFLGRTGEQIYQLPQAVLGAHVHGEIDPHLWHDVSNAIAYVKVIRDTVVEIDPDNAEYYRAHAAEYIAELEELDEQVATTIEEIPEAQRHLVTTHDAFGYLGHAYDVDIAGFVTPQPSTEPSIQQRRRLVETIQNLQIPAVFLEPGLISRSNVLVQTAHDLDVEICTIYGDAFDEEVNTYVDMMRFNADSLKDCLG
ncbi:MULTISPECIES: anchored repeat ABC transporter, substrate-binding protein [Auritidibacter]|uniref:anchored repeat ABC transporter, substrate-binding protein n=1 Tax=Auritidibacter TaxID=1160973 RepID=UPI000D73C7A0|nr:MULTISPECIES: anchored repeat ABC transporter, substrate-binding protein [Auritidibacter]AXR73152.1 anchored repeat ABC transporter, substrate-binding protein [Auritidibacter sp. NML130574]NIH71602.1 anchored repeat ABC transporter substrate-binding protein [Auritidibacter ignavus]RMX24247.1 anchored repeat ABC transporter, substrate-binding protein [Auritidibacter ignavus]WGH81696.1 anchored repeat ABC transporter, substrate-binding protein [Auritidibacter ignavus]WGH90908.1 anchored repea